MSVIVVGNIIHLYFQSKPDKWAQSMKLKIDLASLRWDKEVDAKHVKEVFVKEAEAKAEMFVASLDYLQKLKGILTHDQLKELEAQGL